MFLAKLPELEKRVTDLSVSLQQNEVLSNPEKLAELAREHNELKQVIDWIKKLESVNKKLAECKLIIEQHQDPELVKLAEEEIGGLKDDSTQLTTKLTHYFIPPNPLDNKNVIMEIRAGTGGDEAELFAKELFRMYTRFTEKNSWQIEVVDSHLSPLGGIKELIAEIKGQNAYGNLKFESGVHRVQRIPQTEKAGRVHTSAATVAVFPEAEEKDLVIKDEDLRIDVYRSTGHGGQSVNTTDSAVRITHLPSGLFVTCQDEKSQHKNKAKALTVLRSRLLAAEAEKRRSQESAERKSMIGTGDRSEKIRTYNYPQDRLTDHRAGQSWSNLIKILDGNLEEIVDQLKTLDQENDS